MSPSSPSPDPLAYASPANADRRFPVARTGAGGLSCGLLLSSWWINSRTARNASGTRPAGIGAPRPAGGSPLDSPALRLLDAVLTAGAAARLTRLVVVDDAGEPIREAVRRLADRIPGERSWLVVADDGLACPYCVAVWVSTAVVGSYALWGQRGLWRAAAGSLAVSYAAGHAVARLDEE